MPLEIERKFLVKDETWRGPWRVWPIRQGYLTTAVDTTTVRIRAFGSTGYLTVKSDRGGPVRAEYEYEIPIADADEMLRLCAQPLIEKVRHHVPFDGRIWEVDVFGGANAGLVLAEIEFDRPHQRVALPPWAGREVTDDMRYRNAYLARHPFATWRTVAA
jgi:CYTH domain-containing protein